jgi:hypothetical protein
MRSIHESPEHLENLDASMPFSDLVSMLKNRSNTPTHSRLLAILCLVGFVGTGAVSTAPRGYAAALEKNDFGGTTLPARSSGWFNTTFVAFTFGATPTPHPRVTPHPRPTPRH